mmetsp:Transcript_692/g.798  ORF Transcript_692/g.798 Transcript_692/m.798 type:complete len:451 (+) Transcript_692:211-1563(+)
MDDEGLTHEHYLERERIIRAKANKHTIIRSSIASLLVFCVYLITLETVLSCALTLGLTLFWYYTKKASEDFVGGGISWIVLGFAVVTPITVSIRMAFQRRERALHRIAQVRSFSFQIYLSHSIWEWGEKDKVDEKIKHVDEVMDHLIGFGDELSRFLTLPTSSRSFHRMLKSGRMEAAEIVELQYRLFDSLYTRRITKLSILTEKIKSLGLTSSEASRIRQFERYIGEAVEGLRMIKMYRTPQALRSFARIFTVLLPPLYAASFAQVAFDLQSLTMGILFSIITPLCLTALYESMQAIEDPFVGWITLDGIDVIEELNVLHWHQLMNARREIFPNAPDFIPGKTQEIQTMLKYPAEGGLFDLSFMKPSFKTTSLDGTGRKSHYAIDAISGNHSGLDGSGRVSHFAIDAMNGGSVNHNIGLDGSGHVSHYAMDASHRSTRTAIGGGNVKQY